MAIIYTYPVKATPANDDLILISDSADSNKTKQIKVSSLPGGSSAGVSSLNTTDGTYINLTPNSATIGAVTVTADLSAIDGTSVFNTRFLSKDNTWDVISPAGSNTQIQFNNNGSFGASSNFTYTDSTRILTIGDQDVNRGIINIAGGSSGAGELRLGDPGTSGGTVTLKGGNDHAASYTIKLPDDGPSASNKILESDASGNLTWINTPTKGDVGFSPMSIYEGTDEVGSGIQSSVYTYLRQSVVENECTINSVDFFRLTGPREISIHVYEGTIVGGAQLVLSGTSSGGNLNEINKLNFNKAGYTEHSFSAGQSVVTLVSFQYAGGVDFANALGNNALFSNLNLSRGSNVYYDTSTIPVPLADALENLEDPTTFGVCLHFYKS